MSNITSKVKAKLRGWSHVRFEQPVAIIESDDWGMWRSPDDKSVLESLGDPKIWGYDQLEKVDELERLYSVLECFKDAEGKSPFIEANFVVCNPDFDATINGNYEKLVLKPIYTNVELRVKWLQGIKRQVFLPQYHGMLHFHYNKMLNALQNDFLSRKIFEGQIHGGINNYKNGNWALHSEYQDWQTGIEPADMVKWIEKGLNEFEATFGFRATSTIAPQYIFTPATARIFHNAGIRCIQGTNMQIFKNNQNLEQKRHLPLGSLFYNGLVAISRNVKFEPSRGFEDWSVKAALRNSSKLISDNIPVIIDSHRINYVGIFAKEGLSQLELLLDGLCRMGVRFLSSVEMAEAILNDGSYHEFYTGRKKKLNIIREFLLKEKIRHYIL